MNFDILTFIWFFIVNIQHITFASLCGCKTLRPCYEEMVNKLMDRDEVACIEDSSIGTSTILIFLKALSEYCPEIITVHHNHITFEDRYLYEVTITYNETYLHGRQAEEKPVIIIDAGQQAGQESVGLALYVVEQLVACMEYKGLIEKVKWIILPSTNPDGLEYSRYSPIPWKKNTRPAEDQLSFGVDITRNFDSQWGSCARAETSFSSTYPGVNAGSENETLFIKEIISKHKNDAKIYVSIRRDGHAILYPYGYTKNEPPAIAKLKKIASEITLRVNQRASGIHQFVNESIYNLEGKPHCGNSVDYAIDLGIPLAFEMRVFLGSDSNIITKFQPLPRGYEASLRSGYFTGIRELYNVVTNEKKYGKI